MYCISKGTIAFFYSTTFSYFEDYVSFCYVHKLIQLELYERFNKDSNMVNLTKKLMYDFYFSWSIFEVQYFYF